MNSVPHSTGSAPSAASVAVVEQTDLCLAFVSDLQLPALNVQAGIAQKVGVILMPENYAAFIKANEEKDLYFLCGVPPSLKKKRASDKDITIKHHFFIDVDMRSQWQGEIADGDIQELAVWSTEAVADHPLLSLWRYVDFTGNGFHLHYFGAAIEKFSHEEWKAGLKRLLQEFFEKTKLTPDWNCINVARLCRLPGSHNNKSGRHVRVEILAHQEKAIDLTSILKSGREFLQKTKQEARERAAQVAVDVSAEESTFAAIQNLPIGNLVARVMGWECDGRHFREPGKGKPKACFVPAGENFLVHGGSDHIPATHTGYSPFTFVKTVLKLDNAQTFAWFREHYPEIASIDEKPKGKKRRSKKTADDEAEEIVEEPIAPEEPIDLSLFQPITSGKLSEILELTIKKDNANKLVTFLCQVSAYTDDSQFNISYNAPSSTGKSYIPTEIAALFPEKDVMEIGYCSPQAFFHDWGKFDKERKGYVIDLSRKILIFLDQPHVTLLQRLRPLLSHDKKEMHLKITDKSDKGGLRTKNVFLRGFPAVIFCTAGLKLDEQESTRFFLLSPEAHQEKLRASIQTAITRGCDKQTYISWLEANPERRLLRQRITAIRQAKIDDVKIAQQGRIEEVFLKPDAMLKPRHQRDVRRLLSLVKAFTLLNFMFRKREGNVLLAEDKDIEEALGIWKQISESQEYNLPPYIYDLYREVMIPAYNEKNARPSDSLVGGIKVGISMQELLKAHYKAYHRHMPHWQLRQEVLPMLETAGLIETEPDPQDKRKVLMYPTLQLTKAESQEK